jgi:hypothetical protein
MARVDDQKVVVRERERIQRERGADLTKEIFFKHGFYPTSYYENWYNYLLLTQTHVYYHVGHYTLFLLLEVLQVNSDEMRF